MTSTTAESLSLSTRDGRTVSYDVVGPADGPAVLLLAPAPGSRRFDPDPAVSAAAGVRLITVDRPGYGGSDPQPELTISSAADDAAAVLDALGVTGAGVAGWSAGGRVAAALAASRPELVRALALVGTPAPDEEVPWIAAEQRGMIAHLRSDPDGAYDAMLPMLTPAAADPAGAAAFLCAGAADEVLLEDAAVRRRVVEMLTEAFRQGAAGLVADLVSYTVRDWDLDLSAVAAPTTCWYGEHDALVGVEHGRWWAARTAGRLEVVESAGHLLVVPAWQRIVATLV